MEKTHIGCPCELMWTVVGGLCTADEPLETVVGGPGLALLASNWGILCGP